MEIRRPPSSTFHPRLCLRIRAFRAGVENTADAVLRVAGFSKARSARSSASAVPDLARVVSGSAEKNLRRKNHEDDVPHPLPQTRRVEQRDAAAAFLRR